MKKKADKDKKELWRRRKSWMNFRMEFKKMRKAR